VLFPAPLGPAIKIRCGDSEAIAPSIIHELLFPWIVAQSDLNCQSKQKRESRFHAVEMSEGAVVGTAFMNCPKTAGEAQGIFYESRFL